MSLTKETYKERLIDEKVKRYLKTFGAVSIEGPKWCGKTWTSLNNANTLNNLEDDNTMLKAQTDINLLLNGDYPILIDEWNLYPKIWDNVRRKCDETSEKGKFILTCSTKLTDEKEKKDIKHSGAGRIGKINMYTMSLYESGDSTGKASIMDMYNNKLKNTTNKETTIYDLVNYIIRGGWPSNLETDEENYGLIPSSYIEALIDKDIYDDRNRNKTKMKMLLKSLARNESSLASNSTILKDISDFSNEEESIESRLTLDDYLNVLYRLHIIENQPAYNSNYRSKERVGKNSKRHFTDPSLAVASLGLSKEQLLDDMNTFGFLFESLVERDLRIYMDYLNGNLYHFRDNVTGLEVDSILEFSNGEYATVEIKTSNSGLEDAKKNLLAFYDKVDKKPKFMCIIVGINDIIAKDPDTGIYIIPITALKP